MISFGRLITAMLHFRRDFKDVFKTLKYARIASSTLKISFLKSVIRGLKLKFIYKHTPEDVLLLGLYKPEYKDESLPNFISRNRFSHLQLKNNPGEWRCVTENKIVFAKFCKALNLPVPELYAVFFKNNTGYIENGRLLSTRDEWIRYFENDAPDEFLIKPADGVYGKGINLFVKKGNSFYDLKGNGFTAEDIFNLMYNNKDFNSFIIQQRLKAHSYFKEKFGSENLHTVRLVTHISGVNDFGIFFREFKIIAGNNFIDNFKFGKTGNIIGILDEASGRIRHTYKCVHNGLGLVKINQHPDTGVELSEIEIPGFDKVKELVKKAAEAFLPIRTVGWDIGVCDDGPFIIEGNMHYDPPFDEDEIIAVVEKLKTSGMKAL